MNILRKLRFSSSLISRSGVEKPLQTGQKQRRFSSPFSKGGSKGICSCSSEAKAKANPPATGFAVVGPLCPRGQRQRRFSSPFSKGGSRGICSCSSEAKAKANPPATGFAVVGPLCPRGQRQGRFSSPFSKGGSRGICSWLLRDCFVGLLIATALSAHAQAAEPKPVLFDWFEYRGNDAAFETPVPEGSYRNPVLAGFHPDPSITRAGDKFYLVNSSFAFFPGIPVFESTDLVHWKQIGNVIDRPSQLDFDGLGMSRGVFAPAIEYHDGTFYVVNTAVDSGGNFIATAKDPAGPWSDLTWLPTIGGIDPSLFFDDDGRTYILNNDAPVGKPRYDGHRAIWLQEFDVAKLQPFGPRKVMIDGGVDPSTNPIWIEGPHIYKRDGWYYLSAAEGGTGPQHSQVVLRSRKVWGPYTSYEKNPILTQRDLPPDRKQPITNAGHADLVEGPDGRWWATFLASRNYDGVHYNTGRETFLLPVEWKDGWPVILDAGREIPYIAPGPSFMSRTGTQTPSTGNFTWRDEFDASKLDRAWMFVRVPKQQWAKLDVQPGRLAIQPLAEGLDTLRNPSFLGRRQQHIAFEASTALTVPTNRDTEAGLAAFQNEKHWYFFGVRRTDKGMELFLRKKGGGETATIASTVVVPAKDLKLKISGDGRAYSFAFDADGNGWKWLKQNDDGTILSTETAGGFVGAVVGPYAYDSRSK